MQIVEFILARISEDEVLAMQAAQSIERRPDVGGYDEPDPVVQFVAKWNPWRVMSLCVRRRQELLVHHPVVDGVGEKSCSTCGGRRGQPGWPCATLLLLANEWHEHPDFRSQWALSRNRPAHAPIVGR